MEKVANMESWEEVIQNFINSRKFKEVGQVISPLTIQTPLKNEASCNRVEIESSDMEVDSINPNKKLKINHDQYEDADFYYYIKEVSLVDRNQESLV